MEQVKTNKKINLSTEMTVLIACVGLFIIFSAIAPNFLTVSNVMNVFLYSAVTGICATGMTLVIISGGLDISVGSVVGLTGMVAGLVIAGTGNVALGIFLALLTGAGCGALNGLLVTRFKIVPIIATLATMSIFRGMAMLTTNGQSQIVSADAFKWLGRGYLLDVVPYCVIIMIAMFIIIGYVLKNTPFGRKTYSIGGNPEASRLAGMNVKGVRFVIYILCGLFAGLSGIVTASQTGTAIPAAGEGLEMDVIGAVVLGGASMSGGKGSIVGTLLGVLIFAILQNGLTLLNVMSFWQTIAKGIVLVIAVMLDVARGGGYE
ncbi:ABC transporter permease [Christensenella tenuis]|jgi:ribose/xylose/arabinose/galactoside ABC-type transport system permease subunit|uniref:ABC transporter permease n=1 Tax=Christensenella tenuis TaxID=2763033 RepID=A0ABR7EBN6_9FIRM|nr:ABC transporter permease [Christensenella tenuis]MBC5647186.1 ABC transporter permease [Christensenella tenuis]